MPKGLYISEDQTTNNPNISITPPTTTGGDVNYQDSYNHGYKEGFMDAKKSLRNCGLPIGEENHRKLNKALTAYFDAISPTEMRDLAHEHLKLYFLLDEHGAKERDAFIQEWPIEQPHDAEGT